MQDTIGNNNIPSCFFSSGGEKLNDHDHHHNRINQTAVTRSGQSVVTSVYRTKIADRRRVITVTWCKNLLLRGLSVSIQSPAPGSEASQCACKVDLKPWHFWRKHGSKRLIADGCEIGVFWDLKAARFLGETEPSSGFFVAVVCGEEVVLLLGDLKKDAYKKTACRPALVDPTLVSRREHVFGRRKFSTRARFHEKGKLHEISIECKGSGSNVISSLSSSSSSSCASGNGDESEMEIRLDGHVLVHVKHLQWKFRGNESIHVNKLRVEVFWDVHDWLFSPGLRHALFIFRPVLPSSGSVSSLSSSSSSLSPPLSLASSTPLSSRNGSFSGSFEGLSAGGASEFCLFLYAWKVE